MEDSSIRNVLMSFIKAETKETLPLFDRTIVMRYQSLVDVLEEDDEKLRDHLDDYLDFAEDLEPEAVVENQDYRYEVITTAFPNRDHLQKLWEEIYSIGIDIGLSNRKLAEIQMKDEEDYEQNLSKFPTEEALFELKNQFNSLRIKYYDKVYSSQLQN